MLSSHHCARAHKLKWWLLLILTSVFVIQCVRRVIETLQTVELCVTLAEESWTVEQKLLNNNNNNNNNNNKHDNVYGAVIMAEPLREFTRFI